MAVASGRGHLAPCADLPLSPRARSLKPPSPLPECNPRLMPAEGGAPRQAGAGRGMEGVSAGTSTATRPPLAGSADEATAAADRQQPLLVPAGLCLARKMETALIM